MTDTPGIDSFEDLDLDGPSSGPMKALDMHLAYWEWASTAGRLEVEYRQLMETSYRQSVGYTTDYRMYADHERRLLNEARTIWISPGMMDLALHNAGIEFVEHDPVGDESIGGYADANGRPIAASLNKDLWLADDRVPLLRQEMLPENQGLIIFGKPFPVADYDVRIIKKHGPQGLPYIDLAAVGWQVVNDVSTSDGPKSGVVLYTYINPRTFHSQKIDYYTKRGLSVPPLSMIDFSGWAFDREFTIGSWDLPEQVQDASIRPHVASVRMLLASIWGLMGSYIEHHRPTRPQMKLAKRLKRPEDGDVSVIHLRKFLSTVRHHTEATDYDDEGNPRWSHRWIVRGHWAWRACKCEGHGGRHRVYIDPYCKGPEHLPLVLKEKVYSIDR